MKKCYCFTLFALMVIITCAKKEHEKLTKPLASIGNGKITVDEFQTRFEFTPRIYHYAKPGDSKRYFVASLIAEKLLSEAGQRMRLDTILQIALMTKQMEKEAVIEALFEQEIADKIQISEEEIKEGFIKSKQELKLKYIVIDDMDEAFKASELLKNSAPFDSVAAKYLPVGETIPIKNLKWGEAVQSIEDVVFKLKPGEITEPIEVEKQFYIFQLENKTFNAFVTESDYYQSRPSIEKQIRRRKRARLFSEFINNLLDGAKVTVPGKVFDFIATELEDALNIGDGASQNPKINANHLMLQSDYVRATSRLADNLDRPFANFNDGSSWTIRDFLTKLWLGPYPLNYESKRKFRASLRRTIPFMIELERLAQQGYQQGLHKTSYVREQTRIWQDNLIASAVQQILLDTLEITDDQCRAYYETHKEKYLAPAMLNIQEILVDSRELAERLLEQIRSGADIALLAKKYSRRQLSAKQGGISGYFTHGSWGAVGKAAAKAKPGEFLGPIQTENNRYSIFKILDNKPSAPMILEKVKNDVKRDVFQEAKETILERYLQNLVDNYDISIDTEMLDSIKVIDTGSGMVVWKQHFPGRTITPFVHPTDKLGRWQADIYRIYNEGKK